LQLKIPNCDGRSRERFEIRFATINLAVHRLGIIRGEQCEHRGRGSFGISFETCMSISSGSAPWSRATSSTRRVAAARSPGAALIGSAGRNAEHVPQTIPPLTRTTWPLTRSPSSPTRRDDAGRVLDRTEPLQGGVKKVWEADPLRCPKCSREMRIVSLIDQEDVIERILRHLGLWQEGMRVHCGTDPPDETTLDPWLDDPFPDCDTEPVMAFSASLKRPAAPECASRTPCSAAPSPPARAPQPEKARV